MGMVGLPPLRQHGLMCIYRNIWANRRLIPAAPPAPDGRAGGLVVVGGQDDAARRRGRRRADGGGDPAGHRIGLDRRRRSEEHTSELQSLMRISYAVFCLKKKKHQKQTK